MPAIAAIIPALAATSALTGLAKKATDTVKDLIGGGAGGSGGAGGACQPSDQASNTLMDSGMMQLKHMMEAMSGNTGGNQQNGGAPSFGGMRA